MSEEPKHQTSRAGVIFVAIAVGGSAVGVVGWHLMSNRGAGLDTTGFDVSSTPEPGQAKPQTYAAPMTPVEDQPGSLGMVKGDASMRVVVPGPAAPKPAGEASTPGSPKDDAVKSFKEAALKNEKVVDAYIRKMQAKHPSIARYGKDWAASPELRALRDQYWKDKDPLKFAYGMARSKDFSALLKKYSGDPGIRDVLITGIKQAPPSLLGAIGGIFQNDKVAKDLVTTVSTAIGLPPSLTAFLGGGDDAKAPDQNKVMADIMGSDDMKKAMQSQPAPVAVGAKEGEKPADQPNGFRPLGGR